jgi:hypothetical protein
VVQLNETLSCREHQFVILNPAHILDRLVKGKKEEREESVIKTSRQYEARDTNLTDSSASANGVFSKLFQLCHVEQNQRVLVIARRGHDTLRVSKLWASQI